MSTQYSAASGTDHSGHSPRLARTFIRRVWLLSATPSAGASAGLAGAIVEAMTTPLRGIAHTARDCVEVIDHDPAVAPARSARAGSVGP